MALYSIRVVKAGRTILRKQISEGLGRDAVVIQAQGDTTYLLGNAINGAGPNALNAKRFGKNLHIAIGKGNPDVPDLIIEGYFDFPFAPIAGSLADGGQANYDLSKLDASAASSAKNSSSDSISFDSDKPTTANLPDEGIGNMGLIAAGAGGLLALGGGGSGSGGGSNAADTVALSKVMAFAADGSLSAPTLSDYSDLNVRGVTITNLAAVNSAVDALASANVDSKTNIQLVVDAYTKILAEANSSSSDATSGINPFISDYAAIGANIGLAATSSTALNLLNDVVSNLSTTSIDTIAEINVLAAIVDKVMGSAAGSSSALSAAEFQLLGLPANGAGAVTSINIAAVNAAIAGVGGQLKVDTYSELTNLVTAVATIVSYAQDNTQAIPTAVQYANVGITGVTSNNLDAISSAVDANTAAGIDTKAELQAIVDAVNLILAEANGTVVDATSTANPTAAHFLLIGANIGLAASNPNALNLLNDIIGSQNTSAVDSVFKINALASVVDKVIQIAAGSTMSLTLADCALIGLPSIGNGAINVANIAAINSAIMNAGGQLKVDTIIELNGLVTAVATIANYANDNTQVPPTFAQYAQAGITGVTNSNLVAINSTIDANTVANTDTKTKLQSIVDNYNLVLAEANGSAADATPGVNPSAAQYALLGANIGAAAASSINLSLLNDVLSGLTSTAVDTIPEINDLASATNAVIASAAGGVVPTLVQLVSLGITGVGINNIQAVQNAITNTADSGLQVDTMQELQTLVTATVNAASTSQNAIQNYATSSANPAPSINDYNNIGVSGVTSLNLASVNSAIDALTTGTTDTPYRVQASVDAYIKILTEANGIAADSTPVSNPTANDYDAIGASIGLSSGGVASGVDLASSALNLLDDAVASLTANAVDTVGEINALSMVVDKVMNLSHLSSDSAIPLGSLTIADLNLLGINTSLTDTTTEVNTILQAIINSADSGSSVNTIMAIQAIVNANSA